MSLLKNKHALAALIITPVLALIAFFATDYMVSEKPQAAKEGNSYALIGRSNCRYTSGICTLKNGDFLLDVSIRDNSVFIAANLPLQGIKVGINDAKPQEMSSTDAKQLSWQSTQPPNLNANDTIRLVAKAQNTLYYASQSLKFINKKTLTDHKF